MKKWIALGILLACFALAGCILPPEKPPWEGLSTSTGTTINIAACTNMNSAGDIYNLTANVQNNGTCMNITDANVVFRCNGFNITGNNTASTTGLNVNQNNATVTNCNIRNYSTGVSVGTYTNGTITNLTIRNSLSTAYGLQSTGHKMVFTNINIVNGQNPGFSLSGDNNMVYNTYVSVTSGGRAFYFSSGSWNNFTNVTGVSITGQGLYAYAGGFNRVVNSTFTSTSGPAVYFSRAYNVDMIDVDLASSYANGAFYGANSSANNTFINCTVDGRGNTYAFNFRGEGNKNNTFLNNTIQNATTLVYLNVNSSSNIFYLNNFTNGTYYVNDTNGSNFYNYTYDGKNQGNIYENVLNGSVNITGNLTSSIGGLFIGYTGPGFPYNNSTSNGKFYGNVVDYAPLTLQGISNLRSGYGYNITKLSFRPIHAYQSNVEPVNQTSAFPLFKLIENTTGVTTPANISISPIIPGLTVKCAPYYNKSGIVTLNATPQWIVNTSYSAFWQPPMDATPPPTSWLVDTNYDCVINQTEMDYAIALWGAGNISSSNLMITIGYWNNKGVGYCGSNIWCWADFSNPAAGQKFNITVVPG